MGIQQVIERLEWFDGTFPRRALKEAVSRRHEVTPILLEILADAVVDAEELLEDDDYMGHYYSMYLLAQFRERRAYPLIVELFSLPDEIGVELTGDIVTEGLDRILASVSRGDTSLIKRLAEDEAADEYARNAALEALLCSVVAGEQSRGEVMAYYKSLFNGVAIREPSHFWNGLVSCSTDLYPAEVREEIGRAFANGLVDETFIDMEFIEGKLALGEEAVLAELRGGRHKLVEDVIAEMEWWACFHEGPAERGRKVGRNEACPCGSGRKYKKCCAAEASA